jgi:predicted 2-oxoglutarate/Fe(II)-dependent dioxygenase YbiX
VNLNRLGAGVFTIPGFLTPEECASFISRSERIGYSEAAIRTDDGDRLYKDARNNDRIIFDDSDLADTLFSRASASLPAELDGWSLSGFNERFRFYRYDQSQQFTWHLDGTVRLSPNRESCLTFMIYLNDDFEGGSTDFGWETVKPVQGMALGFPHRLRHQGAVVRSGVKYVLRTDVLYQQTPARS